MKPRPWSFSALLVALVALAFAVATRMCLAYLGVTLSENDMTPGLLAWTGKPSGSAVGGHCVAPKDWSEGLFDTATWGELLPTDEAWFLSHLDEAFSIQWKMAVAS